VLGFGFDRPGLLRHLKTPLLRVAFSGCVHGPAPVSTVCFLTCHLIPVAAFYHEFIDSLEPEN
jgi:hypothetical protein